jgi:hypothetical protein
MSVIFYLQIIKHLPQMFACWYCDIYPKPIEIGHDIYNNDFLEKPVNHILTVRV